MVHVEAVGEQEEEITLTWSDYADYFKDQYTRSRRKLMRFWAGTLSDYAFHANTVWWLVVIPASLALRTNDMEEIAQTFDSVAKRTADLPLAPMDQNGLLREVAGEWAEPLMLGVTERGMTPLVGRLRGH